MSDDQFTKLFKYMQTEFAKLRADMATLQDETQRNFNRVYDLLDSVMKKQETDEQERLAMGSQVARHEAWIERTAPVIKVTYT